MFENATAISLTDLNALYEGLGKSDNTGRQYGIVILCDPENRNELYQKVYPKNGKDFKLNELYKYVGEPIELIRVEEKFMIINEEGKLNNFPINMEATNLANTLPYDVIVGNALICGENSVL